jgi:hypothetical protein
MIRRLTVLLVAAVALTVPGRPAQADPATDPTTLPRGAEPQLTWLGGRTIHAANGHETQVPVPPSHAKYLRLLGKSRGQWIVVDPGVTTKVLAIRGKVARTFWKRTFYEPATTYALSRGGTRVVQWYSDRGGTTTATVFGLDGHVVRSRTWNAWGDILDFSGDQLVLGFRHTQTWTPGASPRPIAGRASAVDVGRDVLFVGDADYRWGPTSLAAPGTAPWYASFTPRSVSPDGSWVAGFNVGMNKLQVRSMVDGSLAPVTLKHAMGDVVGWEPDGHVIVGVHTELGNALVRCDVEGACERATDWLKGEAVNLPYAPQYFGEY